MPMLKLCPAALAVLCLSLAMGCSGKYDCKRLAANSAEQARILQLLAALKSAGAGNVAAVIARDGVAGLNDRDRKCLQAPLAALARADVVELAKCERFGRDICRATFKVTSGAKVAIIPILLKGQADQLRWLQPN
jgi:hypothetical protein